MPFFAIILQLFQGFTVKLTNTKTKNPFLREKRKTTFIRREINGYEIKLHDAQRVKHVCLSIMFMSIVFLI